MNGLGLVLTLARLAAPPVDTAVVRDIQVAPGEILRTTTIGTGQPLVLIPGLFAFAMIQYALNPVFQLAKGTAPVVAASAVGFVVNAVLIFLLPPRFGSEGFALAQSGGMLAALVIAFALASRGTRFVLPLRDIAVIVAATAVMTGVLAPFRRYEPALLILPMLFVAGGAIFMLVMTTFNVAGLRDELRSRLGRSEAQRIA